MNNVVPFRPRSEVLPSAVPVVRTSLPRSSFEEAQPLTVEAGTPFLKLWQALHNGGFALVYDQRTRCFLVKQRGSA